MSLIKDNAVVLRRLDYSETSLVLAVLTRSHGQQRLIAKGVKRATKKRASTGIDLLELGAVVFSQRPGKESHLSTLTEWRQRDTFPHLRTDLARWYAGQYAAEVTSQLTEVGDPHPALFDALCTLLAAMADQPPLESLVTFLWSLLREIGLRPELERCVVCQRPVTGDTKLFFSARTGGAVCWDCEPSIVEKRRMAIQDAVALSALSNHPRRGPREPARTDRIVGMSVLELLDYHLTELMSRPPKLSQMLLKTLRYKR